MKFESLGVVSGLIVMVSGLIGMVIGIASERTESEFITKYDKITVIREDPNMSFNHIGHYCRYYLGDSGKYVVSECDKYKIGEGILK